MTGSATWRYLSDASLFESLVLWPLVAGVGVSAMCGVLSVFVVVKKLGFVGQGVSHSAFGGVGLASLFLAIGLIPGEDAGVFGPIAQLGIVMFFCVGAALGMAGVSDRRTVPLDTSIGLFLVASMAIGAILVQTSLSIAQRAGRSLDGRSWESILFGSILGVGPADAAMGLTLAATVLLAAWVFRRPMTFWVFDEESAKAFGVPAERMKMLLMILLALAVVTAMKLVGVVLATALLVLPGATALKISDRLNVVVMFSVAAAVSGLLLGLVISFETNWQTGPCVVLALAVMFGGACVLSWLNGRGAVRETAA